MELADVVENSQPAIDPGDGLVLSPPLWRHPFLGTLDYKGRRLPCRQSTKGVELLIGTKTLNLANRTARLLRDLSVSLSD